MLVRNVFFCIIQWNQWQKPMFRSKQATRSWWDWSNNYNIQYCNNLIRIEWIDAIAMSRSTYLATIEKRIICLHNNNLIRIVSIEAIAMSRST